MRILFAFFALCVLGLTPAFADGIGCGGDDTVLGTPGDMSIHDLASPRDLASPSDLSGRRDAMREHRRRVRSAGAGLIVLAGLGMSGVAALRRRVRA